jgi:hypothetical protein
VSPTTVDDVGAAASSDDVTSAVAEPSRRSRDAVNGETGADTLTQGREQRASGMRSRAPAVAPAGAPRTGPAPSRDVRPDDPRPFRHGVQDRGRQRDGPILDIVETILLLAVVPLVLAGWNVYSTLLPIRA